MSAYIVFIREETTDQSKLDAYKTEVPPSFEGHDIKFLAAYGPHEVLEGAPIEGAVILGFETMDAARAWYVSPAYQAAAKHRFEGANYRALIIQGL
jgi:uncharacterized protein (DUF1330 family)